VFECVRTVHSHTIRCRDLPATPPPQNTAVGVPWFAFGHSTATYGPDAEAFNPDRWLACRASKAAQPTSNSSAGPDAGAGGRDTADKGAAAAAAAAAAVPQAVPGSKLPNDPWTFSIGPRDCAGQALARMELQVCGCKAVLACSCQGRADGGCAADSCDTAAGCRL
jgi:cytochrome P450